VTVVTDEGGPRFKLGACRVRLKIHCISAARQLIVRRMVQDNREGFVYPQWIG